MEERLAVTQLLKLLKPKEIRKKGGWEREGLQLNSTHRTADNIVLIWMPADVPNTGVMVGQFRNNRAC